VVGILQRKLQASRGPCCGAPVALAKRDAVAVFCEEPVEGDAKGTHVVSGRHHAVLLILVTAVALALADAKEVLVLIVQHVVVADLTFGIEHGDEAADRQVPRERQVLDFDSDAQADAQEVQQILDLVKDGPNSADRGLHPLEAQAELGAHGGLGGREQRAHLLCKDLLAVAGLTTRRQEAQAWPARALGAAEEAQLGCAQAPAEGELAGEGPDPHRDAAAQLEARLQVGGAISQGPD